MSTIDRWIRWITLALPGRHTITLRLECRHVHRTRYARRRKEAA